MRYYTCFTKLSDTDIFIATIHHDIIWVQPIIHWMRVKNLL